MLKDIQFCSCSRLYCDKLETQQCMIFSFTPRALKMLSKDYLEQITANSTTVDKSLQKLELNEEKTDEIEFEKELCCLEFEQNSEESREPPDFAIYKIDDNRWRIPVLHLDQFLMSLFRFLPGYFQPLEHKFLIENGSNPICCLNITANSQSSSNTGT